MLRLLLLVDLDAVASVELAQLRLLLLLLFLLLSGGFSLSSSFRVQRETLVGLEDVVVVALD